MKEFKLSKQSELVANKLLHGSALLEKCGFEVVDAQTWRHRKARHMFAACDMELCMRDWTNYNDRATRRPDQ